MAYATSADLVARFDTNIVQDLASDTGTPVASGDLAANARVVAALAGASGRVNSALMVAGVYTPAMLATLTGDDLAYLKDIVCCLAMASLIRGRTGRYSEQFRQMIEATEEMLELLRAGKNIFNLAAVTGASTPEVDGPSTVDYTNLNLLRERCRGYYPARSRQLPLGR